LSSAIPAWLAKAYQGLDADVETRRIVAAAVLSDQVEQLRSRGFKTTEALVILARKLLRVAYAVWCSGKPFEPHRFTVPV
jgi:5,10-methylenetetrahydrofolate reductase